jgi:hypothetical protein
MSIAVELPDVAAGTNSDAVRIQWIVGAVTSGTSMPFGRGRQLFVGGVRCARSGGISTLLIGRERRLDAVVEFVSWCRGS